MTLYDDTLSDYITAHFATEDEALRHIREQTPRRGLPAISIQPEEGRFLQLLARASGVTRALEIGTLGGYSGTWIARGLAPGGRLLTLEKEPAHAEVAREHFALAGVADRVELRVGDAHALLPTLADGPPFDFVFIDAEKEGYPDYWEWAVAHLVPGGVVVAHNAFRGGKVAEEGVQDGGTEVIRALNRRVAEDDRLLSTIYPAGDGMLLAVKQRE